MWRTIFNKLRDKGLNPYPPGQHEGLCEKRYCVVKENTQVSFFNSNKTGYRSIDIILFVPLNSYIQVEPYAQEIRSAIKEITSLRKTGYESPIIPDNDKKAYTTSIEYQILKKLEG